MSRDESKITVPFWIELEDMDESNGEVTLALWSRLGKREYKVGNINGACGDLADAIHKFMEGEE